jgi:hypothetical protein
MLYEATRHAVEHARSRVFVSYLRGYGPGHSDGSLAHIDACRAWAMRSPGRRFRRVIRQGANAGLAGFIADECAAALAAKAQDRHYNVRLLSYTEYESEAVRVGLYDYDIVFLTYSSDVDTVIGFSIESREIVEQYFEPYYQKLWASAEPMADSQTVRGSAVSAAAQPSSGRPSPMT